MEHTELPIGLLQKAPGLQENSSGAVGNFASQPEDVRAEMRQVGGGLEEDLLNTYTVAWQCSRGATDRGGDG